MRSSNGHNLEDVSLRLATNDWHFYKTNIAGGGRVVLLLLSFQNVATFCTFIY